MNRTIGDDTWRFRPDIEGLRAIAILGVVLFHAGIPGFSGGFLGVDVFFVLSGFLITGLLVDEVRKRGTISLPGFWARRAKRLLPVATLVSLVTLFLVRFESPLAAARYGGSALSFATYWSNLLFWRRGADYFDQSASPDPFLHTWSLAVEEQYYLLFAPCVCLLALAVQGKGSAYFLRQLRRIAVAVTLASLLAYLVLTAARPVFAFYGLPTRMWEFGVGSLLAIARPAKSVVRGRSDQLVAGLALAAVVAVWFIAGEQAPLAGVLTLLPVLGTAALIQVGARGGTLVASLLQSSPMRWLGRLSYSWYLWHWPITIYWTKLVPSNPVPLALGMPLLSLGLAQLSYASVEHPARTSARLQTARRGLLLALVLTVATMLTATATRWRSTRRLRGPEYAAILQARDARTRIHLDGCDRELRPGHAARCSYGRAGSDTTVVLFGDSHAAQWFPALEPVALERGWRLVPFTRPGCPSVAVTVWTSMANRPAATCERWRTDALEQIAALRPRLVIISNYRWHSLLNGSGPSAHQPAASRSDLWERGLQRTLEQLPAASTILLLEDNPVPRVDIPSCLVEHLHDVAHCAFARDSGLAPAITRVERAAAQADPRVDYAELTFWLCDGQRCPAVRGDTVRYADSNHLSVGFVASLSPPIRRILNAVWIAHPLPGGALTVRRQ